MADRDTLPPLNQSRLPCYGTMPAETVCHAHATGIQHLAALQQQQHQQQFAELLSYTNQTWWGVQEETSLVRECFTLRGNLVQSA